MKKISTIITITLATIYLIFPLESLAASSKLKSIFYYFPSTNAYQSLKEHYKDIDVLAPQLYILDLQYHLNGPSSSDSLTFARKKKMKVMPLVYNDGWSKPLMTAFLADKKAQDDFINELIKEAKKQKFIGWQFDFENIDHLDREAYVSFVARTEKAFSKKNLDFSVAVIPRRANYDPSSYNQDWSSAYNIESIAKHADFVSIMSYDDPQSTGPVASMSYVEAVLNHTLKTTPASKISLGIPLYCWQWDLKQNKKIANIPYYLADSTKDTYQKNPYSREYSRYDQAEHITFTKDDGSVHSIWCDNADSIKAKVSLAKKKGLIGTSSWSLGQEDPEVWDEF